MTQETEILNAFMGKISPISLTFKGSREKGLVNFGEVRLPNEMVEADDELLAQLGRAHSCEIKKKENYVYIVPLVIIDKIKREVFVTSHDEEFIGELNRWMRNNFKVLLTKMRGNP